MAARSKKTAVSKAHGTVEKAKGQKIARALMQPSVQAAATIQRFEESETDLAYFTEELAAQVEAVNGGDLKRAEAILITQAHTLNELFNSLARRAANQEYLKQYETYFRLALKAQSQCRATLETLSAIKNPPIVYARQANVTTGPQQINNGTAVPTRAREIETEQTQLSGGSHELLPDTRASGEASRTNQAMEALGEIDRAEVRRG